MPLYEYQCEACGKRTEKIQKFSDPELTVCPHCGGKLDRTITAPAVQFAGGGWYKDLYSSTNKSAGTATGSGSADGGGSASKTDAASAPSAPAAAAPASKD